MLYPLIFRPICKERVWGGRRLEALYGKELPPGVPIGESWEISDRPGEVSVITNGPLAGKDLHWLVREHGRELFGRDDALPARFPLLIKILDAQDRLSVQVHPPATAAAELGGEPKTELWYVAEAAPGAELYAGLKRGTSRQKFEQSIQSGKVQECFHRIRVRAGDALFLPSGRVHALGAGLVIFEIQQNSDTTYRIFDWNRAGLDGKPRPLHVAQSLASINFTDFEPELIASQTRRAGDIEAHWLVQDRLFEVECWRMPSGSAGLLAANRLQVLAVVEGRVVLQNEGTALRLRAGQFCLVPAVVRECELQAQSGAVVLRIEPGNG